MVKLVKSVKLVKLAEVKRFTLIAEQTLVKRFTEISFITKFINLKS